MSQYKNCPICNSNISFWKNKIVDDDEYCINICQSCKYSFVNPRPSIEFISNYYSNFKITDNEQIFDNEIEKYAYSTVDAKRIVKKIARLNKESRSKRFLDVGCGHGLISKEAKSFGYTVDALELSKTERNVARVYAEIEPINLSFENYEPEINSFDVVNLSQILEHAVDINLWISKSNKCLVKGGMLAIALPNFNSFLRYFLNENDPYICPPVHLNFFNLKSLVKLLDKHGFDIVHYEYISRIPDEALIKRVPKSLLFSAPLLKIFMSIIFKLFDIIHVGIMINVYAKKR